MTDPISLRRPVSTRHAVALAFDLAVRRDVGQSVLVPLLLRAPWVLTWLLLTPQNDSDVRPQDLAIRSIAVLGDFVTSLVVGAMLRFRARSVFNTPVGTRPTRVIESYLRGLRRMAWLLATEIARNFTFAIAASFSVLPAAFVRLTWPPHLADLPRDVVLVGVAFLFVLPTLFIAFRLAVATEAVVLDDHDLAGAFQHSFQIMRGRFERWFELIVASALLVLGLAMCVAALTLAIPVSTAVVILWVAVIAIMPVIQYAWTFFYLRLVEVEQPVLEPVAPAYGGAIASAAAPDSGSPESSAPRLGV